MDSTTPIYNDLSLLNNRRNEIKSKIDELRSELKVIDNTLIEMFDDEARSTLAAKGKDFGQVSIFASDHKITINHRKKVEWDQEQLARVLDQMDIETARHYATAKYTVAETKYQAAPPDIKAALSECRTVMLSGISVDIEGDE